MTAFMNGFYDRTVGNYRYILRGLAALTVIGCAIGLALHAHAFFFDRFENHTGQARWIWQQHRFSSRTPVAFFAVRSFELSEQRDFVRIKIAAWPAYTLFFNGREIGGGSRDPVTLDSFDATQYARTGVNRLVVSVRSGDGVGGLLVSVDLAPTLSNAIVSGPDWQIFPVFHEEIVLRNPPELEAASPLVLGRPPAGKWDYPDVTSGVTYGDERFVSYPVSRSVLESGLPEIRTVGGVVIATVRPAEATLFDFGVPVAGRPRLETSPGETRLVRVRYLASLSDLDPAALTDSLVLGEGETSVIDPQTRHFRYAVVYASDADLTLVTERPGG